jgi:hypothetical protein
MSFKVHEVDCSTGQTIVRDSTPEEDAQAQLDQEAALIQQQAEEQERQENNAGRSLWRLSRLASVTPQQAHDYIQAQLEAATTVAEMKALLVELLPALAAGLVVLGRRTLNE